MSYDPFGNERKAPEDKASNERALKLVSYLNTRKEPQSAHAETVLAFVSQKAAADHQIRNLQMELDHYRNREMNRSMDGSGRYEERAPRLLPIPSDARSVEVKF